MLRCFLLVLFCIFGWILLKFALFMFLYFFPQRKAQDIEVMLNNIKFYLEVERTLSV